MRLLNSPAQTVFLTRRTDCSTSVAALLLARADEAARSLLHIEEFAYLSRWHCRPTSDRVIRLRQNAVERPGLQQL